MAIIQTYRRIVSSLHQIVLYYHSTLFSLSETVNTIIGASLSFYPVNGQQAWSISQRTSVINFFILSTYEAVIGYKFLVLFSSSYRTFGLCLVCL